MSPAGHDERGEWIAAFALAGRGVAKGTSLFAEWREDLRVEFDVPPGEFRATASRHSGVAVDRRGEDGPSLFLGTPTIEDLGRIGQRVDRGATREVPQPVRSLRDHAPRDSQRVRSWLERLALAVLREAPSAVLRASWVGFSQDIAISRPDRGIAHDARRGSRGRLEIRRSVAGKEVVSIAEIVLRPGDLDADPVEVAAAAIQRNFERVSPEAPPGGPTCAVFAPGVGGAIVHELVGHALEGDAWLEGRSWLARSRGREIAGAWVDVIDDPRRGRAAWRVDDEGEPSRAIGLVRAGRVDGLLLDSIAAASLDRRSTGHGRRSTFRDVVLPRMGCTFLGPGRWSPDEMFDGVEEGVYVRRLEAASVDAVSGHAVFRIIDADRIVAGRTTRPCTPFLMHIEAESALRTLDRVASDLTFDVSTGSCVRDGQPLAVSVGAPTFRVGLTKVFVPHCH